MQSQHWGTHTPANPPKPGRDGNFLKIHEYRGIQSRIRRAGSAGLSLFGVDTVQN